MDRLGSATWSKAPGLGRSDGVLRLLLKGIRRNWWRVKAPPANPGLFIRLGFAMVGRCGDKASGNRLPACEGKLGSDRERFSMA